MIPNIDKKFRVYLHEWNVLFSMRDYQFHIQVIYVSPFSARLRETRSPPEEESHPHLQTQIFVMFSKVNNFFPTNLDFLCY